MAQATAVPLIKTTHRDGTVLEYETIGAGEPVVFLHGIFAGRNAFSRQRALADQYRLVLPSARGHDGSGREIPDDYGVPTSDVADAQAVIDSEEINRFDLVGHSSGGATAFAMARQVPSRVRRVVLIEPSLINLPKGSDREPGAAILRSFVQSARGGGAEAGLRTVLETIGGSAWARLDEAQRTSRIAAMMPMGLLTAPHFQALLDYEVTEDDVAAISAPTLLIYGGASVPFQKLIAARFQALRPEWPIVTIEGAGHNCFREQPERVNAAIRAFLAG